MKRVFLVAFALAGLSGAAPAHPTEIPFDTRGDCESVYAESSKLDRERLVALGAVENNGAAQKTFNETFRCEFDEEEDAWFIIFLGFPQG